MSTISPSQERAALMKASTAKKAIRFAATLAARPMASVAPLLAASRTFFSFLWLRGEGKNVDPTVPAVQEESVRPA